MTLGIDLIQSHESGERYEAFLDHLKNPNLLLFNKIRTRVMAHAMEFMYANDFIHPPVYMFSTLTDPLNHETHRAVLDYYGREYSLNQSLIFHKMALVSISPIKRAFWFSPNIRLESSEDGKRYATEFTQLDFEVSGWSRDQAAEFVKSLLLSILANLGLENSYKIDYLENLKREAYDYRTACGEYLNFDYEINGLEVCSGAQREYEYCRLERRMEELKYPLAYFEPVLRMAADDLLKPSAGAGIGIERLVRAIMGLDDISKIYPFPRRPKELLVM